MVSPSCLTCMDLRYWDKSDLSPEARGRVSQHSHSTRTLRLVRRYADFEISSASCELCAIILEGVSLAIGQEHIDGPRFELPLGFKIPPRVEILDKHNAVQDTIEFFTIEGM